jgi:hypothetical protein
MGEAGDCGVAAPVLACAIISAICPVRFPSAEAASSDSKAFSFSETACPRFFTHATNCSTSSGSNCVPAQRMSSSHAFSTLTLRRSDPIFPLSSFHCPALGEPGERRGFAYKGNSLFRLLRAGTGNKFNQ